jgi:hypothetical protein
VFVPRTAKAEFFTSLWNSDFSIQAWTCQGRDPPFIVATTMRLAAEAERIASSAKQGCLSSWKVQELCSAFDSFSNSPSCAIATGSAVLVSERSFGPMGALSKEFISMYLSEEGFLSSSFFGEKQLFFVRLKNDKRGSWLAKIK